MNYHQAEDFLFNQLANYHKSGGSAYKPGLKRIETFLNALGNPHDELKTIHIAGTNGKGSVSHMLASVFQEAGHKVGLFTSPHLIDFRERFKINGHMISRADVIDFVVQHQNKTYTSGISFFEWCAALAFDHFKREQVDIAIIETGLGGRLDATNVLKSKFCAITSISMDHQSFLGDNLTDIAREKAGIIKHESKVFLGDIDHSLISVFEKKCEEEKATLIAKTNQLNFETDLKGGFQQKNGSLVGAMVNYWIKHDYSPKISTENLQNGLQKVVGNTKLKGRWQVVQQSPLVICDTGHNLAAFDYIIDELRSIQTRQVHMVLGMAKDKDHDSIFDLLPKSWNYYFPQFKSDRLVKPEKLNQLAEKKQLSGHTWEGFIPGYRLLLERIDVKDILFIGGSNFVVAEFLEKK